jgi:biopolymer transport protein ExbB
MGFSWTEMFRHMGAPALAVTVVLAVMGLSSLTVFFERFFTFRRSRSASKRCAAAIGPDLQAGGLKAVVDAAEPFAKQGHLARVVRSAIMTYAHARETHEVSGLTPIERTQRHMARYMEDIGADLRRGMGVLATVGSVAPFVGLLGTVLGIISAFQGIASTGSGGLAAVSAGISEALIVTAFGLAVAIPSVLGFNYLNGQIVKDEMLLNNAASELLDLMETWAEREVSGIAAPHGLGVVRAARSSGDPGGAAMAQSRAAAGSA